MGVLRKDSDGVLKKVRMRMRRGAGNVRVIVNVRARTYTCL
jgi:hypothetical protein